MLKEQANITGSYYLYNKTGYRARKCLTKAKEAVRVNEIDDDEEATAVEEEGLEYESSSENWSPPPKSWQEAKFFFWRQLLLIKATH